MPVTVGTSLTTLYESRLGAAGYSEKQGYQFVNRAGGSAFNAFQVQARMAPDAPWVVLKSSDFNEPPSDSYPVWASANLASLGTDSSALLEVTGAWYQVRLQASVASGTATVDVYAWGTRT